MLRDVALNGGSWPHFSYPESKMSQSHNRKNNGEEERRRRSKEQRRHRRKSPAMASSLALFSPATSASRLSLLNPPSIIPQARRWKVPTIRASVSARPLVTTAPDDLVSSILSKVKGTDRGVSLTADGHREVGNVASELAGYCVEEPVKSPLIFGEWDVLYCSVPTSPGGGYRSAFGRLIFKTNEMVQAVEAPDIVRNKVSFSAFGFLDGEVSLKGKLNVLDGKWIQVIFEPPQLKVGSLEFQYGGESEVKLQITYIDEKIRLGMGSRGSLFVFLRRG
ncbi:putative plastid-lipid-associated protein 8, chloroplastic [Canna indica]|uniref:Plastid-lipid-associated protein 8, chloroplastic n=1 Tax=Canna indica TaxID=4628 RepID=A0AAQ3Q3R3_9LILI|nr:putative plastid-lipid-associated protein 8, chloroplastic [Canna indica]